MYVLVSLGTSDPESYFAIGDVPAVVLTFWKTIAKYDVLEVYVYGSNLVRFFPNPL